MADRDELGRRGERAAEAYLCEHGFQVVTRNWRCRHGEVDLILRDGRCLVFCEVKTRRGRGFGEPLDAVTWRKVARLRRLASAYLAEAGGHAGPVRIDAVGILWAPDGRHVLTHVRGVA